MLVIMNLSSKIGMPSAVDNLKWARELHPRCRGAPGPLVQKLSSDRCMVLTSLVVFGALVGYAKCCFALYLQ